LPARYYKKSHRYLLHLRNFGRPSNTTRNLPAGEGSEIERNLLQLETTNHQMAENLANSPEDESMSSNVPLPLGIIFLFFHEFSRIY